MLQCWSEHAKSRPSFAELYETLDGFLSAETALVIYFNSFLDFKNRLHKQIQDCNTQSLCTQPIHLFQWIVYPCEMELRIPRNS